MAALTQDSAPDPAPALAPGSAPAPTPAPVLAPAPDPTPALAPTPGSAPAPTPAAGLTPAPAPTQELEPTPGPPWSQGGGGVYGDVDVTSLLRLRQRMKEQLMEYNAAILADQENFLDNGIEENFFQSATQDLETDIEEAKISFQNKTLALQRIQIMEALRNKLKQDDEESRLILETMKHIVLLSRTIADYQQQAHQKEQQLIDIKRKRLSLKKHGGQKLPYVHTMMKKEKIQASVNVIETEKMLEKLEKERQRTTIIQNVFQNVIIGSRVNWAEDPSLKAIVLQLEKNVYLQ